MNDLITEARELCAAATPGPWEYRNGTDDGGTPYNEVVAKCPCCGLIASCHPVAGDGDAAFIARSRTLIPALCDALEAYRWIPVTERLPEIDVAVLVLHTYQREEYSTVTMGRLYQPCDKRRKPYWTFVSIQASDGMVYNDGTDFICPGSEFVTHWMPLPAPPEKEEGI